LTPRTGRAPARRKEAGMKVAWKIASQQGLAVVIGLVLLHGVAAAAGGGGGGDASNARQDPALATAVQLIQTQQYDRAVPLLEDVIQRDPRNADAYNWLAYATRKNGDPAKAIPIYQKALEIDPRHLGAHEYIGEAYLALDDLAHAKEHLKRLDKLCLLSCEEYRDLKKAVQAYEKSNGKVKPAAAR
jgi:tetratricopeptide (TPR) repeat protein